jgi:hypothetical protein
MLFSALALAMALNHAACGADSSMTGSARSQPRTEASPQQANTMKIRLTVNGKAITATLIDSETTRDFVSLLAHLDIERLRGDRKNQ